VTKKSKAARGALTHTHTHTHTPTHKRTHTHTHTFAHTQRNSLPPTQDMLEMLLTKKSEAASEASALDLHLHDEVELLLENYVSNYLCMCACAHVCVCVRERKRERESVRVC